jgi:ABC-type nitrate/sulfonate/bicarbonate transport system ATPase subunit
MNSVHVAIETPVGKHPSARRTTILPWRHVLLRNVNFGIVFPLDSRAAQETDIAGLALLQLRSHERLQCLAVSGGNI